MKVWVCVGAARVGLRLNDAGESPPAAVNPNVPSPPFAVFCTTSRASFSLVNVQVMSEPGSTKAAGTVTWFPTTVPNVPALPVTAAFASAHVTPVRRQPAGTVSVSTTGVVSAVATKAGDEAGVPTAVVVTDTGAGAAVRFVVPKVNVPVPPSVDLAIRTSAGAGVLANVHMMSSPA